MTTYELAIVKHLVFAIAISKMSITQMLENNQVLVIF